MRKKICILPKLNDCGGDVKKQWFIYYSYVNPANNKMTRFRLYDGFTECVSKKAKYEHSEKMIKKYKDMLLAGWSPFEGEQTAIYEESLQYATATRIFQNLRSGNKTFNYYSNLFCHRFREWQKRLIKITFQSSGSLMPGWQKMV